MQMMGRGVGGFHRNQMGMNMGMGMGMGGMMMGGMPGQMMPGGGPFMEPMYYMGGPGGGRGGPRYVHSLITFTCNFETRKRPFKTNGM
jgi:hypothetical protein